MIDNLASEQLISLACCLRNRLLSPHLGLSFAGAPILSTVNGQMRRRHQPLSEKILQATIDIDIIPLVVCASQGFRMLASKLVVD